MNLIGNDTETIENEVTPEIRETWIKQDFKPNYKVTAMLREMGLLGPGEFYGMIPPTPWTNEGEK